MDIKHVYVGLPEHLIDAVLWVGRKFRTNPLSHIEGGSDVVVEYHDGSAYGYDWVKMPSSYIRSFFSEVIRYAGEDFEELSEAEQLELAKSEISRLYARKYEGPEAYSSERFEEIWNAATSTEMPWERLKDFDFKPAKSKPRTYVDDFDPFDYAPETCDWCGRPGISYRGV